MSGDVPTGIGAVVGALSPIGALGGALLGKGGQSLAEKLSAPNLPTLQSPNALSKTPTLADAQGVANKKVLDREQAIASTSSILTGGAGLLDQPTTTSRTLIGA